MSIVSQDREKVKSGSGQGDEMAEINEAVSAAFRIYSDALRYNMERNFQIGRMFNEYSMWNCMDLIIGKYGEHTYKKWLEFGRVARKWNPQQVEAHKGKPWTWFRNNNAQGPDMEKAKKDKRRDMRDTYADAFAKILQMAPPAKGWDGYDFSVKVWQVIEEVRSVQEEGGRERDYDDGEVLA